MGLWESNIHWEIEQATIDLNFDSRFAVGCERDNQIQRTGGQFTNLHLLQEPSWESVAKEMDSWVEGVA